MESASAKNNVIVRLSILVVILCLATGELTCALLFFGIGRKFKEIAFPSIKENILVPNPACDVFVHIYNVTKVLEGRIGDDGTGTIDASEIFLLANRSAIMVETEEEFQRQQNVHHYRSLFPLPSRWDYPSSMDNMIRQWHSIEKVWAKMEACELALHARYSFVGLFRLDVLFTHPIFVDDADGAAIIPRLMYETSRNKYALGGYNDRLFYGKREYAKSWATERFNSVPSYLRWQKANTNYNMRSGLHSEDFLRWMLVFQSSMPLSLKPICFKRIRSSGMIMNGDCALLRGVTSHEQHFSEAEYKQQGLQESKFWIGALGGKGTFGVSETTEIELTSRHLHSRNLTTHHICAIVRTHQGHANLLPITLLSLTQQSYQWDDVKISLFVVNTDSEGYADSDFMHAAAADANMKAGQKVVFVLDASFHKNPPNKATYGYDVTDRVLDVLLGKRSCTHFLFTNGDNFYVRSLVEWIKSAVLDGKQLIAWDFLSHHKRNYNVIKVQFIRRYVDLGSVLVDRQAIVMKRPHVRFLPDGSETGDLFARDYFFFKEIYDQVGEQNVSIIHQVLFAHQ